MIRIDAKGKSFIVELDLRHEHYQRVYILVRSLLSALSIGDERYTISFDDFVSLKKKLDSFGLVQGRTISPAAIDLYNETLALIKRNQDIKKGIHNEHVKSLLKDCLKVTLYEDQITGVSYIINNRRVGLFDAMGLGKTVSVLSSVIALKGKVRKTLVICPKSVMLGFGREIEKHTYLKYISIPSGKKKSYNYFRENKDGNWDVCLVHPENLVASTGRKNETYSDLTKLLKVFPFDMVLIDEAHMYKNLSAKRSKCVLSLVNEIRDKDRKLPRVVLMTGTPVSESPLNAYVVLKVLSDERLPHVSRFENYFMIKQDVTYGSKGTFKKVTGYKNLGELKDRIEKVSIRRTKADMKGFPDQVFVTRDVLLSGKQEKLYKTVLGELVAGLSKESVVNLQQFFDGATTVRLRQLMNHPAFLDEDCNSAKYDEIDNLLDELFEDPEQKVIIWSEYRKAIDLIYDRWNSKYGVIKIRGGVEINDDLAKSFESASGPRIAACIPAKAGTGVDFLARARTAIYIDRPYSYTLYKQSIDRIHRRVKTKGELSKLDKIRSQPATIIFLDVPNSVDELVRDKLFSKQDMADSLTMSNQQLITVGREDLLRFLR